jgi:tetratricopeptide (TPR) repeat protein
MFPEMVDIGMAGLACETDPRAAVAEARRAAESRNGPHQDVVQTREPGWPVETGSLAEAVYWYRQLAGLKYATPDVVAVSLCNLAFIWRDKGRWDDAEAALQESLQLRRRYNDRAGQGQVFLDLGHLYEPQGRWSDVEIACSQSAEIAHEVGDRWTEASALGHLGVAQAAQGQVEKAVISLEKAVAMARAIGPGHWPSWL